MVLSKRSIAGMVIFAALWSIALAAGCYAAEPTAMDLDAVVRALGFLETLQRDGTVDIAVVYGPSTIAARKSAGRIAERLSSMAGPNKSVMHAVPVQAATLDQDNHSFDAIFLMPGASAKSAAVLEAVRKRQIVTISNDPACLKDKSCVLMIRTKRGVEIVLQTALADAVGARFSPVFSMMVKRQ